jgi:hypothetical protein
MDRIEARNAQTQGSVFLTANRTKPTPSSALLPSTPEMSNSLHLASAPLNSTPTAAELSAIFLNREQSLVGLPIIDQSAAVSCLVAPNTLAQESVLALEASPREEEKTWPTEHYSIEQHLGALGEINEKAENRTIFGRVWAWFGATLGLGGLIARRETGLVHWWGESPREPTTDGERRVGHPAYNAGPCGSRGLSRTALGSAARVG